MRLQSGTRGELVVNAILVPICTALIWCVLAYAAFAVLMIGTGGGSGLATIPGWQIALLYGAITLGCLLLVPRRLWGSSLMYEAWLRLCGKPRRGRKRP